MATSSANLGQSRTRSLRGAPPTGGLKLSSALNPPTGSGPSNLTLFLTNVHLLDLDLRKDWPDITLSVLTSKDAKKRIQCVEWALYQLFVLWDPEEARNKLQPFYPPLEPLQSLNLRTALYRCLDQAKKNGVLGRDTVLRKTMLDECKGERLEEVLAVFSNAVLQRKVQEATTGPYQAIAQQLASENFSYSGERTILSALILAHKASLSKHLQDKNNSRAKYHDFAELLNLNQRRATRRHEQLKESIDEGGSQTNLSRKEVGELHEKFQKNWGGNSEWTESILYGDCSDGKDGLLGTQFQNVWEHVEKGTIGDLEGKRHAGLLEQLDARVKDQAERLAKWQDFGKTLAKKDISPKKRDLPAAKGNAKIDLGFTKHEALQVRGKVVDAADAAPLQEDYARMLENMRDELANVGKPQPKNTRAARRSLPPQGRRTSSITSPVAPSSAASSPIAEKEPAAKEDDDWSSASSDSEVISPGLNSYGSKSISRTPPSELAHDNTAITAPDTAPLPKGRAIPLDTESENEDNTFNVAPAPRRTELRHRVRSPATEIRAQPITTQPISDLDTELESEDDTTRVASTPRIVEPPRIRTPPAEFRLKPIISPDPGNDELADQILNSMAAVSPSPRKPRHKLSLAERTRLSMARASHTEVSDLHDDFDLPRLSLRPKLTPPIKSPEIDPHADLIERTRKSMAGFEAAQKKAQLDRRRSLKAEKKRQRESSYFPKVKEPSLREEDESKFEDLSILIEGEDPDYEDVFKSRPKIATTPLAMSPAVSPAKSWGAESVMSEDGML